MPAGSSRLGVSSAILSEDSEKVGQKEEGRQDEVDSRIAVSFNRLISALRNHIGKTGSSFYEIMKGRILSGKQPIIDGDKIGNVGQINTLGTFIDEHFALPEEAAREIITNAYDSMCDEPNPGQREVQVELKDNFLSVSDSGSGMSLDTILKKFLPPFEGGKSSDILSEIRDILDDGKSEKIRRIKQLISGIDTTVILDVERLTINDVQRRLADDNIAEAQRLTVIKNIVTFTGRFGIGFYSLLYFLKTDQDFIGVVTCTKTEAHRIQFFRRNGELQTAITVLSLSGLNRGTKVILRSQSFNKTNAQKVINQFLQFNANAKISVSIDGIAPTVINEDVFNPIRFKRISNKTQVEAFYSKEKNTGGKTVVYITVHGVTIMTKQIDGFGMPETVVFNLPANIGLPISRNKILVNEIFIEKAKDMIHLIGSKPELLSAFFPCIEVLELNANASCHNILANAAADAAYSSWKETARVYLPNAQEYTKIKHDRVVLADKRLLRMVSLRGFTNSYAYIGGPLSFGSGEKVVIGSKRGYLVDFVDETKFVSTSDAILINRRHSPKTDTDKALYNVLLGLSGEGQFGYVYQPQAVTTADAKQKSAGDILGFLEERVSEEVNQKVNHILEKLPDERAKSHFKGIIAGILVHPTALYNENEPVAIYISDPTIFLTVYNLLVESGLINIHYNWNNFYQVCAMNGILDNKDKLEIILKNERIRQLQEYFTKEGCSELTMRLLEMLIRETENLSPLVIDKAIERLWDIRGILNKITIRNPLDFYTIRSVVICILFDEDTYRKFYKRLFIKTDEVSNLTDDDGDILAFMAGQELFLEGGAAAIKRIGDIIRHCSYILHSDLALSMRNMSGEEIARFLAIEKENQVLSGSFRFNVFLPQYLRFFYGESWPDRFGSHFNKRSNYSNYLENSLTRIVLSGLPLQEKQRFIEAVINAEEMFNAYRYYSIQRNSGIASASNISNLHSQLLDFTPDDLEQINNPALLVLFLFNIMPFNKDFLYSVPYKSQ